MHPRFLASAIAMLSLLAVATPAPAQGLDKVEIKVSEVAPGIHRLEGAGGALGMSVGVDGVILIDDQFAPLTEKIRAAIQTVTDKPVRFVLNTHFHGDHTGGNENFAKAGAWVVAHDNVRVRMGSEQYRRLFDRTEPASPTGSWPVVTFSENVSFHLNGHDIHVLHAPNAHTDGDAIVHFQNRNVLHVGDIVFNGMYPYIDTSGGGSVQGMLAAVERVIELSDAETKIICGHGPVAGRADLERYRDMLKAAITRVGKLVNAGRTLEEAIAARPMAEYDEAWASSFITPERFVSTVYWSLKPEK